MYAVLFEVKIVDDKKAAYLEQAASLKKMLAKQQGCISIERFESLAEENKLLSLSFWENEESITEWKDLIQHKNAQQFGRDRIFSSYRIRVARVIRDYTNSDTTSKTPYFPTRSPCS